MPWKPWSGDKLLLQLIAPFPMGGVLLFVQMGAVAKGVEIFTTLFDINNRQSRFRLLESNLAYVI